MMSAEKPIAITHAKGAYLYSDEGKSYLDAISSWWVNLHGHAHPYIAEKISTQAFNLEHVMFAGFTHRPAIELAERLIKLTQMEKIFYSDNGSTAVETALKIALQFWFNTDSSTKRKKILSFKDSYHGDTFGAMSASGKNTFNRPFWDHLFSTETIDLPIAGREESFLSHLQILLSKEDIAAFIFEPMILGAGGMKLYSKLALDLAIQLCKKYSVLTIADEVMTGFGRTGPIFACESLTNKPDILCLSKAITGGFLPLGATLCRQKIYDAFLSASLEKALLHGHSYSGNPLACAAALANLDLLMTEECQIRRQKIIKAHQSFCQTFQHHPALLRCESLGTILVLEYASSNSSTYFNPLKQRLYRYFLDHQILLRPLGNTVHVIPPYCITDEELVYIYKHLALTLEMAR